MSTLEIVQSEGFTLSPNRKRVLAFVIDDLLMSILVIILFWNSIANTEDITVVIEQINSAIVEIMFIKFAYHTFFYYQYGATIGKIAMKIRVIDLNTFSNPSLINSMNRSGIRLISEMFFYLGFILAYFDESRQTLQDKLARTVVVDA